MSWRGLTYRFPSMGPADFGPFWGAETGQKKTPQPGNVREAQNAPGARGTARRWKRRARAETHCTNRLLEGILSLERPLSQTRGINKG